MPFSRRNPSELSVLAGSVTVIRETVVSLPNMTTQEQEYFVPPSHIRIGTTRTGRLISQTGAIAAKLKFARQHQPQLGRIEDVLEVPTPLKEQREALVFVGRSALRPFIQPKPGESPLALLPAVYGQRFMPVFDESGVCSSVIPYLKAEVQPAIYTGGRVFGNQFLPDGYLDETEVIQPDNHPNPKAVHEELSLLFDEIRSYGTRIQ